MAWGKLHDPYLRQFLQNSFSLQAAEALICLFLNRINTMAAINDSNDTLPAFCKKLFLSISFMFKNPYQLTVKIKSIDNALI